MSEMTVGCIRTTLNPPLASGIYEALLEKAERERDEARALLERKWDKEDPPLIRMMRERDEAREESLEQARLLGMGSEREARLITERENMQDQRDLAMRMAKEREKERDHYKQAIEEISVTIQDWLDSIVQEPSLDFIKAIKVWADKKLREI